jgi:hypothetical protein
MMSLAFPLAAADRRPHGRSKLDVRPLEGPAVSASSVVNSRKNTRGPWCQRRPGVRQIYSIGSADRSRGTKKRPPGMRKRAPECASTCSCRPPCSRWNPALYAAPSSITDFLNRREGMRCQRNQARGDREERRRAQLRSEERSQIFCANGFRPTRPSNTKKPSVSKWWAPTPASVTGFATERR